MIFFFCFDSFEKFNIVTSILGFHIGFFVDFGGNILFGFFLIIFLGFEFSGVLYRSVCVFSD